MKPRRGKVRDVYNLGDQLLIVATDRISAYDVVMPNRIPGKGKILTSLSLFWFGFIDELFRGCFRHHFVKNGDDVTKLPKMLEKFQDQLIERSMLVRKAKVILFKCVVRGYLAGSGWKEYLCTEV